MSRFPDPIAAAEIRDPELAPAVRHLDCRIYNHCLSIADEKRWPGFSCSACRCFVPMTQAELIADIHPLIECLAESMRRATPGWSDVRHYSARRS